MGKRKRGHKLSDGDARAHFYHDVCEPHLAHIVRVDPKSELFTYTIDERALKRKVVETPIQSSKKCGSATTYFHEDIFFCVGLEI